LPRLNNTSPILLSPEFKLLAGCVLRPLQEHRESWREQLAALAGQVRDWDELLRLVRRHQLPSMAHDALKGLAAAPAGIMAALHHADRASRMKTLRQIAETRRVLAAFKSAGITAVQLKGPALTQRLHGDAFLRDSVDIDVLVPIDEFAAASRVLQSLGATPETGLPLSNSFAHRLNRVAYHHGVFDLPVTKVHVELHWRMHGWPAEFAAAEVRRSVIDPAGGELVLHPIVELVDLIIHGSSHYWYVLKWLADIRQAQITQPHATWEDVAAAAQELGAIHSLRMTMVLSAWIFDGIGPQPTFELAPTAAARFTAAYALRRMMAKRIAVSGPRAAVDRSAYRLLAATPYGRLVAALRCVC
jgi:hypothetical protein